MHDPSHIIEGDADSWLSLVPLIAERIVSDIGPATTLIVGCGEGVLVEALRRRGVEAFGMDASEDVVQRVHTDIQPYCWVGSMTDPFPRHYDLIVCIEVLECLDTPEADRVVANICQYTDDVLFSSTPLDSRGVTRFSVQAPDYWATLFARQGFFRDVDFDTSFVMARAARFREVQEPIFRVVGVYERHLWRLRWETLARRELNIEQRGELAKKEDHLLSLKAQLEERDLQLVEMRDRLDELMARFEAYKSQISELGARLKGREAQVREWERRWADLESGVGWALLQRLQHWRARLTPPGSDRDRLLEAAFHVLRRPGAPSISDFFSLLREVSTRQIKILSMRMPWRTRRGQGETIQIEPVQPCEPVQEHRGDVDIIICVHNALSDLERCLDSVLRYTTLPYSLILVDDGSNLETSNYLREFAGSEGATLLRNEDAKGYTGAANQGLRESSAEYVVLLNSDTVVTPDWLDRLIACAESDSQIGMVGPLSNTASWQSIPDIESEGDWAANALPADLTPEEMGQLVAQHSARLYPRVPFLNGFCLLIRHRMIHEVGLFDEENFGGGYGEENDYALRTREAGWTLAVADDAYVYHAQSRSYSDQKRKRLSERAGGRLVEKHGRKVVDEGVAFCRSDRVLEGIRARSRAMLARREWIERGRERFAGNRILFILPIAQPGGGANVVIDEAKAMRKMGVDARIFNLVTYREAFELAYPDLEIPTVYGTKAALVSLVNDYEAVVATFNPSVEWLRPIDQRQGRPVRGYYVQDFEPYMYPSDSESFQKAWESYDLFPDLVRFTKTEWTRQEVQRQIGVDSAVVGSSVNLDLFRPRPRSGPEWPDRPLRVAAMVRPNSPYRAPELTMALLQRASREYRLESLIFGTSLDDPGFAELPRDFRWTLAGVLKRRQVARFLNQADIFLDFSSHQAMGLTAMEAMACGAAVTVPESGGATSFARNEENSLVVDTSSTQSCWEALQQLLEDAQLRGRIQRNALAQICRFFPERPAFNIMSALLDR